MWNNIKSNWPLVIIMMIILVVVLSNIITSTRPSTKETFSATLDDSAWVAPSLYYDDVEGEERKKIIYGEELIANTSIYLGPKGSVAKISNGMNCQNCHLNAGKTNWGNNYSAVFST